MRHFGILFEIMNKIFKLAIMAAASAGLAMGDNYIKNRIEDGTINNGVIDKLGIAEIEKHHNKGIPLNKFSDRTKEITALSAAVLTGQIINSISTAAAAEDGVLDFANTLITAGALSNTYDRISRGYVVDYLKVGRKKAIYNLSDFMIIGGVILTVFNSFKGIKD